MGEQLTIRMSHEGFCRRQFLKAAGLTGLALLTGCAGAQKEIKDPTKFDMKSFLSWYKRNKLYCGPNPNSRGRHSPYETFEDCIRKAVTPGMSWSVPAGETMIAVAPGKVEQIAEITGTGRPGGLFTYQEGPLAIDEENKANQLLMEERLLKQKDLVTKLDKIRKGGYLEDNLMIGLWHNEGGYKPSQWSTVEKFRFLETLYEMHPHQFPTLPKAELENITKEFYQNQPIILTLPFKKGGLR